jgi:single-stranded-DNA-specific exonuclease
VDVVITDHHALPPALPDARAVVNPKRLPAGHPLYELAGVGCAYKLVEALYAGAGRAGEAAQYLDLVTLGTVADVMALVDDNRYMVQRGLALLRRGERQGVAALMESAEINPEWFTEEHIGFGLGPRLNALGRLDDANRAVDLLTTGDLAEARILARELEGLNIKRKQMTSEVYRAAVAQVERDPALLQYGALVLAHPTWPAGVIGIVANRLVERYGRPAVLLASKAGEPARGSARSVPGCDITAAIAAHAAMLQGFGGHQMAAGLAIDAALIDDFRRALSRTVHDMRGDVPETRPLQIDGYVTLDELTLDFAADVERLAPFGAGNPALTLAARNLEIVSKSIVGRTREHLRLVVRDEAGTAQPVMWWHGADEKLPQGRVDLAFHARASDFKGQRHVELVWVDARPLDPDAITLDAAPAIEVIDHRGDLGALQALVAEGDIAVWAEGSKDAPGVGRDELPSARGLAIWTAPPGPVELADAVERVGPEVVYLFGAPPGLDRADDFLKHLAGMVRYALQSRGGEASLARLAAATTHREATVRAGVEWLAARGDVAIVRDDGSVMQLTRGDGTPREDAARLMGLLKHLLQETREYRKYFSRADKDALISL